MEGEQKDTQRAEWSTAQLMANLMFGFGFGSSIEEAAKPNLDYRLSKTTNTLRHQTSHCEARSNPIRHRIMIEKKKPGRPKGTTSPILEENTALVLELHRRQVDNTNIARIVGVTPPTVAAFIKRKSVQAPVETR